MISGAGDDRVPEHLLADAERVDVVLQRQPCARPAHRGAANEADLFQGDLALLEKRGELRAVVRSDLLPDVLEEPVALRRVRGDLCAHCFDGRVHERREVREQAR
jgi:hypothetical protein